jgi:hypothetical protein
MAEDIATYEEHPLNAAIGRGTIYTALGVLVAVGLAISLVLGLTGSVRPGLFEAETAFAVGGLSLAVLAVAMLVMLFSLTGTIRYINREMQDLTRLRQAIETSYSRLAGATQNLGKEIHELRGMLPTLRKVAQKAERAEK